MLPPLFCSLFSTSLKQTLFFTHYYRAGIQLMIEAFNKTTETIVTIEKSTTVPISPVPLVQSKAQHFISIDDDVEDTNQTRRLSFARRTGNKGNSGLFY